MQWSLQVSLSVNAHLQALSRYEHYMLSVIISGIFCIQLGKFTSWFWAWHEYVLDTFTIVLCFLTTVFTYLCKVSSFRFRACSMFGMMLLEIIDTCTIFTFAWLVSGLNWFLPLYGNCLDVQSHWEGYCPLLCVCKASLLVKIGCFNGWRLGIETRWSTWASKGGVWNAPLHWPLPLSECSTFAKGTKIGNLLCIVEVHSLLFLLILVDVIHLQWWDIELEVKFFE